MGKFYKSVGYCLGLFCAAAFAVQALAADKINLPVDSRGFFKVSGETFRYPTTAKIRDAVTAANPHVEKLPSGGLSQSLPSNIEISATKQTSPISAKVKAGVPALKNGAKSLLKGGLAGMALSAGLQQLLDGVGAIIDEGGQVRMPNDDPLGTIEPPPDYVKSESGRTALNQVSCSVSSGPTIQCFPQGTVGGEPRYRVHYCRPISDGYPLTGTLATGDPLKNGTCYYGGGVLDWPATVPATDQFIDDAVDNHYEPEPGDWELLARHIDPSDPDVYAEIASIPSIMTPPTTKTIYDANGNPVEIQETNIWYDFDITDNNSKQPAIDIKERKETKTYNEHGQLTGTETTTSTSKAASSSSSSSVNVDIPTDCEFMPTVCRFLAWFQEPDPELSNEPDLESLRHDLDPQRDFTVGTSTAGCPEPITISLAMFPSVEVSLQPLCDFVDLLRPLLLAFASYFATLIVLRAF